jgi:hypothetical protein
MRLVGPGNFSGEAGLAKRSAIAPLLLAIRAGAEAVSVSIAGQPNLLASFQTCAETRTPCPSPEVLCLGLGRAVPRRTQSFRHNLRPFLARSACSPRSRARDRLSDSAARSRTLLARRMIVW